MISAPTDSQERHLALLKSALDAESDESKRNLLVAQLEAFEESIPTAMIMAEMVEPRETFVLMRGDYRKQMEKVERDVPSSLPPLSPSSPKNRLGLADWPIR